MVMVSCRKERQSARSYCKEKRRGGEAMQPFLKENVEGAIRAFAFPPALLKMNV